MKNVTVTMSDDALEWLRVKAARDGASVSRFLGQMVEQVREKETTYERAMRDALKFKPLTLPKDFRPLTREEANQRANLR